MPAVTSRWPTGRCGHTASADNTPPPKPTDGPAPHGSGAGERSERTMARVVYDLRRRCEKPGCSADAVQKVNLSGVANYMARAVCAKHADWAESDIRQYIPTDR